MLHQKSLVTYITFYNDKHPHGYLCNRTPSKAEAEYYQYLSQKENNSNRTYRVRIRTSDQYYSKNDGEIKSCTIAG